MADFELIETRADLDALVQDLLGEKLLAFDTEADSFYHYFDQTCLVQVATRRDIYLIDPLAFGAESFAVRMKGYAERLRGSRAAETGEPMAPGDREWREAASRRSVGAPIDPATWEAFETLIERHGLPPLT